MYQKLNTLRDYLYDLGYFILGDSAYAITLFLLPPYTSPSSKISEDDFSFFHSSARITVECAFGEIDLRWKIFWKRLCCSLDNAILIIEGAMHLHNFIVDYRNNQVMSEVEESIDR